MNPKPSSLSRRGFMGGLAAAGFMAAASGVDRKPVRPGPLQAPDGPVLKAGLVGCGGRGTGAAVNFIDAGPNLQIVALADVFEDRLAAAREGIKKERGQEVAESRCFVGFDAYQKLLDTDIDVFLHAAPPHFRPQHFEAAVEAGKHIFLEKPVGVDPTGVRQVLETNRKAKARGLRVMTGTQLRRELNHIECYNRVADGAIGDILSIRCFRNQGALWFRERQPEWTDMEYMIRDWVNWCWLSGDHIVEQYIHELDLINWFTGSYPVKAVGMGGRARRPTGDQYDFFAIDYEFPDGVHMHATTRQVNGCANVRELVLIGTGGIANLEGKIYDLQGSLRWQYEGPKVVSVVQEHVDLVTAIRRDEPLNTVEDTSISTMTAIMGRETAYTGLAVTWDGMMASSQRLGPTEYAFGPVPIEAKIPVPGQDARARRT